MVTEIEKPIVKQRFEKPKYKKPKGKQKVLIKRLNWDHEYLHDIMTDNGFTITEPATFMNVDETKIVVWIKISFIWNFI